MVVLPTVLMGRSQSCRHCQIIDLDACCSPKHHATPFISGGSAARNIDLICPSVSGRCTSLYQTPNCLGMRSHLAQQIPSSLRDCGRMNYLAHTKQLPPIATCISGASHRTSARFWESVPGCFPQSASTGAARALAAFWPGHWRRFCKGARWWVW